MASSHATQVEISDSGPAATASNIPAATASSKLRGLPSAVRRIAWDWNATKRLAAIATLAFELIPQDPTRPEYRQGSTLGDDRKHWFRAKFFQQYRLFFRYHQASRIIVYAWVNDEATKRAYERADDAYRVFQKMLARGYPPDDWASLLAQAQRETKRLRGIAGGV